MPFVSGRVLAQSAISTGVGIQNIDLDVSGLEVMAIQVYCEALSCKVSVAIFQTEGKEQTLQLIPNTPLDVNNNSFTQIFSPPLKFGSLQTLRAIFSNAQATYNMGLKVRTA